MISSTVCKYLLGAALLEVPTALLAYGHATVHIGAGKHACAVFHTPQCWHETTDYRACRGPDLPDFRLSFAGRRYVFRQSVDHVSIGYEYPRGASPMDSGHLEIPRARRGALRNRNGEKPAIARHYARRMVEPDAPSAHSESCENCSRFLPGVR